MKNYLLSLIFLLPLSTFIISQDAEEEENVEEVVVTGIKASLIDALEIKRNKVGVTEIVTAEDIGKFPDGNLAESLARIAGISIERSNIEGSTIAVRGLGPEFNMVTLNGRQMPTAPAEFGGGRAYDFGAISSHGVSRLEVYKSPNPSLPSGGLGATINMVTAKPLESDNGGSLSFLLMGDSTNEIGQDYTPEIEFVNSYKSSFGGLEWGLAVSGSYHDRNNREETTNEITWFPSSLVSVPTFGPNISNNNTRSDGVTFRPNSFQLGYRDNERVRENFSASFQIGGEKVTYTIDTTFSSVEFGTNSDMVGSYLDHPYRTDQYGNISGFDNVVIDKNGVMTNFDVIGSVASYQHTLRYEDSKSTNQSVGFNIEWEVSDSLVLEFDAHQSSAAVKGNQNALNFGNGSWSGYGDGLPFDNGNPYNQWAELDKVTWTATDDIPGYIPVYDIGFQYFGRTVRDLEARDITSTTAMLEDARRMNDTNQFQFKGDWKNLDGALSESLVSVQFGVSYTKQNFKRVKRENQLFSPEQFGSDAAVIWGPNNWDDTVFTKTSLAGIMGDSSSIPTVPYFFKISKADAIAGYEAGYWAAGWGCPDNKLTGCYGDIFDDTKVVEETTVAFAQANFEGEINSKPWKLTAALRYEEIDLATPQDYQRPGNSFIGQYSWGEGPYLIYKDFVNVTGNFESTADEILPSIAFSISTTENTVVRASIGRTIARPNLEDFSPNVVFPQFPNIAVRNQAATSGNPSLEPLISDNIDFAFEYYYGEGSYVALNLFQKDLSNFVGNETAIGVTFPGMYDVRYGLPGKGPADTTTAVLNWPNMQTIDQVAFGSVDWWQTLMKIYVATLPGTSCTLDQRTWSDYFYYNSMECVEGNATFNPLAGFDIFRPENINEGTVEGTEISVQHFFADTGFGVVANYTMIDGDTEGTPGNVGDEFALPGFGDSGNVSVFYEDEKFSARISNNYKAETYQGYDQYNPLFVEARSQVDVSINYNVNENTTVFVEGMNVTDSEVRLFSRYENMLFLAQNHGPVYKIGFRAKF